MSDLWHCGNISRKNISILFFKFLLPFEADAKAKLKFEFV